MAASTALVAYAESFLDGRRTVVFGQADSDLPDALVERGARVVHVYDPDAARAGVASARNRARNVSFAPLAEADVAVRDGAFDVAFVPDLCTFEDPARVIKRVARALSPRGIAFIAAPNPEIRHRAFEAGASPPSTLGYYDLYDAVSGEFDEVRMLGQTPFVGFAVVDFAHEGDTDISFDSGFLPAGAEEPEWYVAAGSQVARDLDAFMVVQLPAAATLRPEPRPPMPIIGEQRDEPDPALTLQLEERDRRIAQLEVDAERTRSAVQERDDRIEELETALARADRTAAEIQERDDRIGELERRFAAEESRLSERDALIRQLEAARAEAIERSEKTSGQGVAAERLSELEAELASSRERIRTLEAELQASRERVRTLEAELESSRERGRTLEAELKSSTEARQRAEAERDARGRRIAEVEASLEAERAAAAPEPDAPDDYDRLEAALAERAHEIRRLEELLRETERTGQALVNEIQALGRGGGFEAGGLPDDRAPAGVESQVAEAPESLEARAARDRADLQAARWTIDELEGLLEAREGADAAALSRQLAEARAELQRRQTLISQLKSQPENQDSAR